MKGELTAFILGVLQDVRTELDEPEVAELTTLALDKKVDTAISLLQLRVDTAISLLETELDGETA
ncbi:hypothetical protein CMI47_04580 [Candidatus Pacearchaeota archaeon]|jgi:hypothetical protein|nr:hypothetical protein [Candidatus Pacearchaeota archaeon]|tara:strand:- start:8797 stop:8991 length:195 start_codon:yes stop_codon:yes gene_type:complete